MAHIHDKDIAVVGVSRKEEKFGYKIFRDLIKHGFKVKGVNPAGGKILGEKIYRDLLDMERVPDIVITVVPSRVTEKVVEQCRQMGIREIWMQPGSESDLAIANAKKSGITVTSRACFMVEYGIW